MDAPVRAERVSKDHRVGFWGRRVPALQEVSFEVSRGEIFGLLGPRAAGKTTALRVLLGFERPSRGAAWILGRPAGSLEARRSLGYLPENPVLSGSLRVGGHVLLAARLAGLATVDACARASAALAEVGLASHAKQSIDRIPATLLQRLALAQALVGAPEVLILDEPMERLDPVGRRDVQELLAKLRDRGRAVLLATNVLSDAEAMCDRVAIMVAGKILETGRPSEVLAHPGGAVEIVARAAPAPLVARFEAGGAKAVRRGDDVRLTFDRNELAQEAARSILAEGAQLVSLSPRVQTLDDFLAARVRSP